MSRKSARIISLGLLVAGLVLVLMAIAGNGASSGGALDVTVRTKDFIITGVYKVYGLENQPVGIWVAKTVFGNQTGGTIRNLRVRYRVDQYTSDWSAWKIYPVVVPGQTVVDCYYPLLSRDCAALTSRTPTDLRIEYEYTDTAGILHTDAASKRLTLLGRHEFVHGGLPWEEVQPTFQDAFSNSPLMAAWVTSNDPPVRRLAGFANEWAGGAGGSITDEGC